MRRHEFYKTIRVLRDSKRIEPIRKGNKIKFRIIDPNEQTYETTLDTKGHLGRLSEELSRLRREYSDLDVFDKTAMAVACMRDNLKMSGEIFFISVISGNETKEQRETQAALKSNMDAIIAIVCQDPDKDKVLPPVKSASCIEDDFGVYKVSRVLAKSTPAEWRNEKGELVYRNFPPFVDKR